MNCRIISAFAMSLVLTGAPVSALQDDGGQLAEIVEKVAPSICTVKAVIRMESKGTGQSQSHESRVTLQGVVVDSDGLVLVSNMPLSPTRLFEMMGMGEMSGQMGIKMTPVSFKVTFVREDKEYDAFLAATDSKLDVAFLKVEALGDRKLPAVDLSASSNIVIGQRVVSVSRLGKGYDYAPFFQTARVNGEIAKPRRAWMLEGAISGYGLPVFAFTGELIGILSTVPGASKEDGSEDSMGAGMVMRMLSGGSGMSAGGSFVLPGSVIKSAADQAKERAVVVAAERAKKKSQPEPSPAIAKKPAVSTTQKKPTKP